MSTQEEASQLGVPETIAVSQSGVASIARKILAVMNEVGYVYKDGNNAFQSYKYASEANAIATLRPSLIKHGLFLLPSVETVQRDEFGNTHVTLNYRIMDADGNHIEFRAAGSGNDRNSKGGVGDKGIYKALTGASKYALLKTFLLETGDDPEVESPEDKQTVKAEQTKPVKPVENGLSKDDLKLFIKEIKGWGDMSDSKENLADLWTKNAKTIEQIGKDLPSELKELKDYFRKLRDKFNKE